MDTDLKKIIGEAALSGRLGPHFIPEGWVIWMAGNRMAAMLAADSWDFEMSRLLAERQVSATREAGAVVQLQFALNFLANNVVLAGDVHAAAALVDEERRLASITGVQPVAYGGMLVDAHRDDPSISAPVVERAPTSAASDRRRAETPRHARQDLPDGRTRCGFRRAPRSRTSGALQPFSDSRGRRVTTGPRSRRRSATGFRSWRTSAAAPPGRCAVAARCPSR